MNRMKQWIGLLLLVLMVMSVTPAHVSDESYYLYPFIGYVGTSNDFPAGEMIEWAFDCAIFFKGIEIQKMIPATDQNFDVDKCTIQSFTLFEMSDIYITYTARAFTCLSTEYLWNGQLYVDEHTIGKIKLDRDAWAQYKYFDISDGYSMGFYAVASGNIQTIDNRILMILSLGVVAVVIGEGYSYIMKRRKRNEI